MKQHSGKHPISRRNVLQFGTAFVGAGSLTAWLGSGALARTVQHQVDRTQVAQGSGSAPHTTASTLTPDEALAKLMEGNRRFVENKRLNPNQDSVRISQVATGQAPFAAILGCADSRVVSEMVFDQGLGDLFVVRVAGNIAITEGIASEEFAVGVLGTPLLVVLGHERCGAVQAALETGTELPGVIESLVYAIRPAVEASSGESGDQLTNAVKENVRLQVRRLQNSSVIAEAVEQGKLKVVGAFYDLDTGEVSLVS